MLANDKTHILLIEDSPLYRKVISQHLESWGYDVTVVATATEGWNILDHRASPKLVLLDWVMPDMDGIELCRKIRARASEEYIYLVLLTGKSDHEDLLQALDAGVDDYIVKPFDQHELKARLKVGQRIVALQDELITARESMRFAAHYDGLTGLMNRRASLEFLNKELARAKREKKPLALGLADVDHFKLVNDELGHQAGDEVLREVGRRLRSKLRVYDGLGRYGGEEFLIVLPGCDLTSALIRGDEVRSFVNESPVASSKFRRQITVSMGVSVFDGNGDCDVEALLHDADLGLYRAKSRGRNRVECVETLAAKAKTANLNVPVMTPH